LDYEYGVSDDTAAQTKICESPFFMSSLEVHNLVPGDEIIIALGSYDYGTESTAFEVVCMTSERTKFTNSSGVSSSEKVLHPGEVVPNFIADSIYNGEVSEWELYVNGRTNPSEVIILDLSTVWCWPCHTLAKILDEMSDLLNAQPGLTVHIYTLLYQDNQFRPCTEVVARKWQTDNNLEGRVLFGTAVTDVVSQFTLSYIPTLFALDADYRVHTLMVGSYSRAVDNIEKRFEIDLSLLSGDVGRHCCPSIVTDDCFAFGDSLDFFTLKFGSFIFHKEFEPCPPMAMYEDIIFVPTHSPFEVTFGNNQCKKEPCEYYFALWVDWNNNFTFVEEDEFYTNEQPGTSFTQSLTLTKGGEFVMRSQIRNVESEPFTPTDGGCRGMTGSFDVLLVGVDLDEQTANVWSFAIKETSLILWPTSPLSDVIIDALVVLVDGQECVTLERMGDSSFLICELVSEMKRSLESLDSDIVVEIWIADILVGEAKLSSNKDCDRTL